MRREKSAPSHHWVSQLHKTFYNFAEEQYQGVTHVFGFVPTTAKAAVEITKQWKEYTEKKDPSNVHRAKVNMFTVRSRQFKTVNQLNGYPQTLIITLPLVHRLF